VDDPRSMTDEGLKLRADVYRRYDGASRGFIVCVCCGAKLGMTTEEPYETMSLVKVDRAKAWTASNVVPTCAADAVVTAFDPFAVLLR